MLARIVDCFTTHEETENDIPEWLSMESRIEKQRIAGDMYMAETHTKASQHFKDRKVLKRLKQRIDLEKKETMAMRSMSAHFPFMEPRQYWQRVDDLKHDVVQATLRRSRLKVFNMHFVFENPTESANLRTASTPNMPSILKLRTSQTSQITLTDY